MFVDRHWPQKASKQQYWLLGTRQSLQQRLNIYLRYNPTGRNQAD